MGENPLAQFIPSLGGSTTPQKEETNV